LKGQKAFYLPRELPGTNKKMFSLCTPCLCGEKIILDKSENRIGILFLFVVYFLWNKEGILQKRAGAYKGEKRKKELSRQKKQEERRQRRFHKGDRTSSDVEKVEQEEIKPTDP
jgi:hypothetical protein